MMEGTRGTAKGREGERRGEGRGGRAGAGEYGRRRGCVRMDMCACDGTWGHDYVVGRDKGRSSARVSVCVQSLPPGKAGERAGWRGNQRRHLGECVSN